MSSERMASVRPLPRPRLRVHLRRAQSDRQQIASRDASPLPSTSSVDLKPINTSVARLQVHCRRERGDGFVRMSQSMNAHVKDLRAAQAWSSNPWRFALEGPKQRTNGREHHGGVKAGHSFPFSPAGGATPRLFFYMIGMVLLQGPTWVVVSKAKHACSAVAEPTRLESLGKDKG